jgi:hypothetical protein
MTYGFVMDVPLPIEMYDAVHAETKRRMDGPVEGLLCHVGRATPGGGFQVIEIWESKELCDRYETEVLRPVITQMAGGRPQPQPAREEFEPRGLIVPAAQIAV